MDIEKNKDSKHRQLKDSGEQTFEVFLNEKSRRGVDNLFKDFRNRMQQNFTSNITQMYNKEVYSIINE